jgi:hypothetical protein
MSLPKKRYERCGGSVEIETRLEDQKIYVEKGGDSVEIETR